MSDNLTAFVRKLSEDAGYREAFAADPKGTMNAAGLSEAEIEAVMSQDHARVRSMIGTEDALLIVFSDGGGG